MDVFVGTILAFGFNYPTIGWQLCDGSSLPISGNETLYALIGTTYGGDGVNTFAVPDLRGRVPIGAGQGLGLSNYPLGAKGGTETTTLLTSNMAGHTHVPTVTAGTGPNIGTPLTATLNGVVAVNSGLSPQNALLAGSRAATTALYAAAGSTTVAMAPTSLSLQGADAPAPVATVGVTGNSLPISLQQPYQVVNYCIAMQGIYPSQN